MVSRLMAAALGVTSPAGRAVVQVVLWTCGAAAWLAWAGLSQSITWGGW